MEIKNLLVRIKQHITELLANKNILKNRDEEKLANADINKLHQELEISLKASVNLRQKIQKEMRELNPSYIEGLVEEFKKLKAHNVKASLYRDRANKLWEQRCYVADHDDYGNKRSYIEKAYIREEMAEDRQDYDRGDSYDQVEEMKERLKNIEAKIDSSTKMRIKLEDEVEGLWLKTYEVIGKSGFPTIFSDQNIFPIININQANQDITISGLFEEEIIASKEEDSSGDEESTDSDGASSGQEANDSENTPESESDANKESLPSNIERELVLPTFVLCYDDKHEVINKEKQKYEESIIEVDEQVAAKLELLSEFILQNNTKNDESLTSGLYEVYPILFDPKSQLLNEIPFSITRYPLDYADNYLLSGGFLGKYDPLFNMI